MFGLRLIVNMPSEIFNNPTVVVWQLWIQERLPLATCKDYGNNLQSVQQYIKKNQVSQG